VIKNPTQRRKGAKNAKKHLKLMTLYLNSVNKLNYLLKQFTILQNNIKLCVLSAFALKSFDFKYFDL